MEKKIYELTVDPELEAIAPPLAKHELAILEADILEHGCTTPLMVWNGTIIDGHHRYGICREHHIPFGIEEIKLADKTEAKLWIVRNQLGRRNLTPFQRCEMVLPLEKMLKEEARKRMSSTMRRYMVASGTNGDFHKETRSILADMAGVSHDSLRKAQIIHQRADEETKRRLRAGEISIHRAYTTISAPAKMIADIGRNNNMGDPITVGREHFSDPVNLAPIGKAVHSLLDRVSEGEATMKTIISELTTVAQMIDEVGGR